MDRRKFLAVTGAAGVAAVWGGSLACATSTSSTTAGASGAAGAAGAAGTAGAGSAASFPLDSVGLQLYTVRSLADKSVESTMQQVAAAGYHIVETHSLYGQTPTALRAIFDKNGIRTVSGHYSLTELEGAPDTTFATAKALGQEFVVLNWLEPSLRNAEFYRGFPDRLNKIGEKARAAGLRFAHHNHDFEFDTLGGSTPVIETVIAKTDPALVSFELDEYWVYKAGADPLGFLEKHPGRIVMIHLKDSTAAPAKAMADVGSGVIEYPKILAAAKRTGVRYAFVERDDATDPAGSIRASHDYLARLLASK
jgi:sugar phosphate isomerase/epimerase